MRCYLWCRITNTAISSYCSVRLSSISNFKCEYIMSFSLISSVGAYCMHNSHGMYLWNKGKRGNSCSPRHDFQTKKSIMHVQMCVWSVWIIALELVSTRERERERILRSRYTSINSWLLSILRFMTAVWLHADIYIKKTALRCCQISCTGLCGEIVKHEHWLGWERSDSTNVMLGEVENFVNLSVRVKRMSTWAERLLFTFVTKQVLKHESETLWF